MGRAGLGGTLGRCLGGPPEGPGTAGGNIPRNGVAMLLGARICEDACFLARSSCAVRYL